ncbi:2-dehydropantoate 2-reductase [Skermania piniformis]|uniref:2-dehydropantoate 2-reductase n=1 Tax=Skermania pinensis TaxID=39122 RepID=UPI000833D9D0|nr:2-dehydropantoate 2-reductase [Skermania piniformis]
MKICVFGAGRIGCYVGGRLLAGGADVEFVGRPRVVDALAEHGLQLVDFAGNTTAIPVEQFRLHTEAEPVTDADLVLVTVKATGTEAAGRALAGTLRSNTVVVSLQNGIGNAAILEQLLPDCTVLPGVVEYNVVGDDATFRQATSGGLLVADRPELDPFADACAAAGLSLVRRADVRPAQWAKLLLNLNNPINALSGLSLQQELSRRGYRQCLAWAQREALAALRRSRIEPARLTRVGPRLMAAVLPMPDVLFRRLAGGIVAVHPAARSSMADDLYAGRRTEIDWLCGEVVTVGELVGTPTPVNRRLLTLVHEAEAGGRRDWSADELRDELRRARNGGVR